MLSDWIDRSRASVLSSLVDAAEDAERMLMVGWKVDAKLSFFS